LRTFGKILGGDSERILEMPRTFSYQANVHWSVCFNHFPCKTNILGDFFPGLSK
jgi:hypothetical protein